MRKTQIEKKSNWEEVKVKPFIFKPVLTLVSIKTKSFFTELLKKTRGFLTFPPRKYHKSYKFRISAPRTDKNMNLAPKCSSWKVPVRYLQFENKSYERGEVRGIKLDSSKKNFFAAYFEKITRGKFLWLQTSSGKVVHNSILHTFAF